MVDTIQLMSYYDLQRRYYAYLQEKLGSRFKGMAELENGLVKTGCYHCDGWEHLSSIDHNGYFRKISIMCMEGKSVKIKFRDGGSYKKATVTPSSFPKMIRGNNEDRFLWKCNEIISVEQLPNKEQEQERSIATKINQGSEPRQTKKIIYD